MSRPITCPYCRQSFDRITRSWRKTPAPKAETPLTDAVTKSLEQQLQQALAALRRAKDTERVLLAQLAAAERQGFKPEPRPAGGGAPAPTGPS